MHSNTFGSITFEIIFISSAQNMSSGSSVHSTSSSLTSTIPTTPQNSVGSGTKPELSIYPPEPSCSYYPSGPASASFIIESDRKSKPRSRSNSAPFKSSPILTFNENPSNANSDGRPAGQKGKSKWRKGCISGIKLDFHYQNLLTSSGRGRSTLGTGAGAPAGCDIM